MQINVHAIIRADFRREFGDIKIENKNAFVFLHINII